MAVLRIDGLQRRFDSLKALDGVSFDVEGGEVMALLGENGAGKTTLVEILVGGLRAHGGTVELGGEVYRPRDPRHARARGVVAVHQHFQLVEAFSVAENLDLALPEIARRDLRRRWVELAEDLDVAFPPLAARVCDLGVGDRQWLEIGKALMVEPTLLLLDEPTAVLTPEQASRLFSAVARLAERGTSVLFITHRLDEVRRVADRVVVLRGGKVAGTSVGAAEPAVLAEIMTGALVPQPAAPDRHRGPVAARLFGVACPPRLATLDLEIRSGEITILAGVDGNGQVAVAERLAGLTQGPGVVEVAGSRLENPQPHIMRAQGVAVIPADRVREGVFPGLSVAENLVLGRPRVGRSHPWWLSATAMANEARRLVERYAIVGRPEQALQELSGGNQQKVVVARVLADRLRILVAMHPTRGLDIAAQQAVHGFLLEAAAEGAAVLMVTTDLEEARSLADRILVFSRGRVVGEGDRRTPADVLARWVGGEAA